MGLDDGALAHHVRQCQANAEEGYRTHFLLHGPDLFATGLLLACGTDWGLDVRELLSLLVGSSPASTGADEDLDFVRARVVEHPDGPETLRSLDDVRAVGPDVAAALDRFLLHHGWRLITSYDLDGRCLHELPELVLTLVTTPRPAPLDDVDVDRSAGGCPRTIVSSSIASSMTPASPTGCGTTTAASPAHGPSASCGVRCSRSAAASPTAGASRPRPMPSRSTSMSCSACLRAASVRRRRTSRRALPPARRRVGRPCRLGSGRSSRAATSSRCSRRRST